MQGLILLDKPEGMTSFGLVSKIKKAAHEKRVGHTGTLDPMATGVLPVFIGRATALSSFLLDADKRYIATVKLGITTDTDDITGKVISEKSVSVTNEQLNEALEIFTGKYMQQPPMYSALKKDGERLYKLAREGKTVDIPKREVNIISLELLSYDGIGEFSFDVEVSKGTYIRSLARDIGEYLGCGATLSALRRTETAGFSIDSCVSPERVTEESISELIVSEETAVKHLRQIFVTEKQAVRFTNGGQLDFDRLKISNVLDGELFRVKKGNEFYGIGQAELEKNQLAVKCVINYTGEKNT